MTSRRGLQIALTVLGVVAVVFGCHGVVTGVAGVRGSGADDDTSPSPNVDSEIRFFAAWYAGVGLLLLQSARAPESHGRLIRGVCGVLLMAACGRVLSIRAVGRPSPLFRALMGIEFAIPIVVVPWHAKVARSVAR
jgi:hypothetical protein